MKSLQLYTFCQWINIQSTPDRWYEVGLASQLHGGKHRRHKLNVVESRAAELHRTFGDVREGNQEGKSEIRRTLTGGACVAEKETGA